VRVFVEYFGLMERADYAQRAREKAELAKESGIRLIAISPDDDWEAIIWGALGELFGHRP
jgi:hypothetical protein